MTAVPTTRRFPSRRAAVLGVLVCAIALGALSRAPWTTADATDITGSSRHIEVGGYQASPTVVALALVAAAAGLALMLSSRVLRVVVGALTVVVGLTSVVSALVVRADPVGSSVGAVAEQTGALGGDVAATATPWSLVTLIPSIGLVLLGVFVIVRGRNWPRRTRYARDAARNAAPPDPQGDPAGAWDALSRGEDPSEQTEDRATRTDTPPSPGERPPSPDPGS